jgi:uncharacterized damage-inducible protein DinB
MKFNTVEEVYGANDAVRARLLSTVDGIEDEAANQTSLDGSWNVAQILEHV